MADDDPQVFTDDSGILSNLMLHRALETRGGGLGGQDPRQSAQQGRGTPGQ